MNKLPAWWNAKITIFNKYEDTSSGIITWYKTSLSNCFWKNTYSLVKSNSVEIETNNIICRIPSTSKFMDKLSWDNYDNRKHKFTLAPEDIIILGRVNDTIDEYTEGHRSSDLLKKYSPNNCMQIKNVNTNIWTGNSLSHYYVVGV